MVNVMLQKINTYFTTGVFVILSVLLAASLIQWVASFFDGVIISYIPSDIIPQNIYGGGLIISLVLILTIGTCVSTMLVALGGSVINAIAFLRAVYCTAKTILSTALTNPYGSCNQAVLVQYPYKNTWVFGRTANMIVEGVKHINVFVPTPPHSTSGMFIIADMKDTKVLSMSVKEALQFVITTDVGKNVKAPKGYN